ncbi:MAG TPA: cytochrome ubiquinol oxidase subunit I, partial [Hypericibacter adhaerens]|uniref:cytochrome ubiquinol oxidase subunit I n=1 Tax=Hypericibacter adhaerens TaxID=2602016 RepID=UPI002B695CFE
ASRHRLDSSRFWLKAALWTLPLPWLAIEAGWFIAEFGRQPWVVEGVLPTAYAASGLHVWDLAISLTFYLLIYSSLLAVMVWLMVRAIKHGPAEKSVLDANDEFPASGAGSMEPAQ